MTLTAELILPEVKELIAEGAFSELRLSLKGIPPADIADIVAGLEPAEAAVMFRFLARDDAGEVFAYLDGEHQELLINELGASASRVVEGMDPDDAAKLLEELPTEVAQRLIASLKPEERREVQAILGYPAKSVGRLMTPDYVTVRPEWTVAQAIEHIRRYGRDAETINVVYVVDDMGRLIDDIRLRQIFMTEPDRPVESLMNRTYVALRADDPQEEAVTQLLRYDRVALPVVDSRGVLLGIVTHDDVADVAQEEATEDIQKMGGTEALDEPYNTIPLWRLFMKRGKWLAVLFLGEMLTASAMTTFEGELDRAVVLGLFIPLIVSSGGNSGSQASTLIIRSLALGEIQLGDWFAVFRREVACGMMLGLFLGLIGLVRILAWHELGFADYSRHFVLVGITVATTLVGIVMWGSIIGSMLPFLFRRLKMDPAAISAPFVATLVDVTGIIIYFSCALLLLRSTLLASHGSMPAYRFEVGTQPYVIFNDHKGRPVEVATEADSTTRYPVVQLEPVDARPAGTTSNR
ncbi:MAG: magnesium transporter [Phycisphaeraceae bacterium]|nr:magnesium transporter [Phycisphaeraceae bacterium]